MAQSLGFKQPTTTTVWLTSQSNNQQEQQQQHFSLQSEKSSQKTILKIRSVEAGLLLHTGKAAQLCDMLSFVGFGDTCNCCFGL
jgi:hypothetical protein